MNITIYQIDAFSCGPFSGNPAAICPLDSWIDDSLMQSIAAENNLSETAFFVKNQDAYEIRWFTPVAEVNLCGHATLATAYVLFEFLDHMNETIIFSSKSGKLKAEKKNDLIYLNFPAQAMTSCDVPPALIKSVEEKIIDCLKNEDYCLILENEKAVEEFVPDLVAFEQLDLRGLIISAPSATLKNSFVSRFFAPKLGVNEDPVTGSAHTQLIPYWAKKFNSDILFARQLSKREGKLLCELHGERVLIGGECELFLQGTISIKP